MFKTEEELISGILAKDEECLNLFLSEMCHKWHFMFPKTDKFNNRMPGLYDHGILLKSTSNRYGLEYYYPTTGKVISYIGDTKDWEPMIEKEIPLEAEHIRFLLSAKKA